MQRLLAISLIAATACSSSTVDDYGYGEGLGTPENPVPQGDDSAPYQVESRVDFTIEAILPPQAELVVVTLRAFAENPARGIIDGADAAGVPAVKAIYDALPDILTDKLEGWINAEIATIKINGRTLPEYAAEIAALAETALTQFALNSSLTMQPGTATHTLTAIDFTPAGLDVQIPITDLAANILTQHPTITLAEGGALGLGDQKFGLPFGEYAWQGVNAMSTQLFGANVRDALGKAVNCPALAQTIATKCVLNACVGHKAELTAICDGGLDQIVGQVEARFAAYDINAFRFKSGQARLVDDDDDGIADRIVDGKWDGEMNIGLGLRRAPATFTAAR